MSHVMVAGDCYSHSLSVRREGNAVYCPTKMSCLQFIITQRQIYYLSSGPEISLSKWLLLRVSFEFCIVCIYFIRFIVHVSHKTLN